MLLFWLSVSPVASNLFERPGTNPFFKPPRPKLEDVSQKKERFGGGYIKGATSIRLREVLSPTRVLIGLFFIVILLRALLQNKSIGLDKIELLMTVFSIFLIINVISLSNRPAFGLRVAADAFIVPFMSYFLMKRLVVTEDRFSQFIKTLGYMASCVILAAIVERLVSPGGVTHRLQGPFDGNQVLQVVLAVAFFGILAHGLKDGDEQVRAKFIHPIMRWFVISLAPLIIFLTWSRGNWLGYSLGLWTFVFLGRRLMNIELKIGITSVVFFSFPLIAVLAAILEPPEAALSRITNIQNIESRFRTWEVILRYITDHLITGIGFNNSRDFFFAQNNWRLLTTTHNSYMTILMELGIFGLITYLAIIGYITKMGFDIYRKRRHAFSSWLGIAVVAIIVAYQLPSLFSNNLHITGLSHVFVYTFAGGIAGISVERRSDHRHSVNAPATRTMQLNKRLA